MILADSEVGKEDILTCYGSYGVTPDRIKVLPYVPAPYLPTEVSAPERWRVRARHRLPERFLFYPAESSSAFRLKAYENAFQQYIADKMS